MLFRSVSQSRYGSWLSWVVYLVFDLVVVVDCMLVELGCLFVGFEKVCDWVGNGVWVLVCCVLVGGLDYMLVGEVKLEEVLVCFFDIYVDCYYLIVFYLGVHELLEVLSMVVVEFVVVINKLECFVVLLLE